MSTKCKAVIISEIGKSALYSQSERLGIEEVSLEPPRAGEVLVKVAGAGLCNSDLAIISGKRPRPLPLAMGHEGSGEIVELGEGVRDLQVGVMAAMDTGWNILARGGKLVTAGLTPEGAKDLKEYMWLLPIFIQ